MTILDLKPLKQSKAVNSGVSLRVIIFLLLLCNTFNGVAQPAENYLLVIASQRNAQTIADAAKRFKEQHPHFQILARTDVQLREQPAELSRLVRNSAGILGLGLYGPTVAQLQPLLKNNNKPQLIMHSDHRLVKLSRWRYNTGNRKLFDSDEQVRHLAKAQPGDNFHQWLATLSTQYPAQRPWIEARSYWQAGGSANTRQLLGWFFKQLGYDLPVAKAQPLPRLRWLLQGNVFTELPALTDKPLTLIIDHSGGGRPADTELLNKLCQQLAKHNNNQCLIALAAWGEAGVQAVAKMKRYLDEQPSTRLSSIIMLQDFVIGGGEGREAATQLLKHLNVPVIKAIKLRDRTVFERQLSSDGLSHDKVYYQVAMPELQGASQPLVIATAGQQGLDANTGIRLQLITPHEAGISALVSRTQRWQILQQKPNKDKRIAIIYYNHPPGRHNIGADNLNVPASLWHILLQLKQAGYQTGELPESEQALLDLLQRQGVNLPNDAGALATMSQHIRRADHQRYQQWFNGLPGTVKKEMQSGPFGLLHEQISTAIKAGEAELGKNVMAHTFEEMHHLLEGVNHPGRQRALALVDKLENCYTLALDSLASDKGSARCMDYAATIITALQQTGIEGLAGWGKAPGKVMTHDGEMLLPGIRFGNIFVGPQPPRGWEINEELLHANLAFPPPHQYLAFYHYLHEEFAADALVHLGRHSTYEFLPRRSVGLAEDDYPRIVAGDIPGIYPYIVDGVGEGIQAKRRGLAVMVDHLTPPLRSTPLYDELLQLRQLIESFESMHGNDTPAISQRLVQQIREKVDALELKDELAQAMSAELAIMGISFDDVDDDMLVHEVGHYLTDLQERFMPLGLHIYGKDWQASATEMMLTSMGADNADQRADWQRKLTSSPRLEMTALLKGLEGGYIEPGQGNDPIRSPDSLPTGRNFYALDSSLIPSRVAWALGREMAANARANNVKNNHQSANKREALILWASDVVRDEGVMIAFGLDMLGLEPVWNSRGLVTGLKRQPLNKERVRRDMVFTTSGLFRDLYGQQMLLLNRATLMALDASSDTIVKDFPALTLALQEALQALGKNAKGGKENLQQNQVAAHWVKQARQLLAAGNNAKHAGIIASLRVFGDAPGSYGAGINRLAERSGAWQQRSELADVYLRRLGHSYGSSGFGKPAHDAFKTVLADVENTYFGRSSNLYGLIDNNDAFDYLGGLSLSIETLTGKAPNSFVLDHSDPQRITAQPLGIALRQELRGRFLNPEWLAPLMEHGYAGARTMGSEFLEYLWGWQITNPTLVGDWAWEEVKAVYIDDRYEMALDRFLAEGHNANVKANMLAVMLVAIHKQFWQADEATIQQLAAEFADLVAINGLPGSGHTDPSHPMLPWLEQHLSAQRWQQLQQQINTATKPQAQDAEVHRLTELQLQSELTSQLQSQRQRQQKTLQPAKDQQTPHSQQKQEPQTLAEASNAALPQWQWFALAALLLIVLGGFYRSIQRTRGL